MGVKNKYCLFVVKVDDILLLIIDFWFGFGIFMEKNILLFIDLKG